MTQVDAGFNAEQLSQIGRYNGQHAATDQGQTQLNNVSPNKSGLFKKRLPGVGSEPGSSQFHLFSHFHPFAAEPQRLPT
jgi:hypothetical protein